MKTRKRQKAQAEIIRDKWPRIRIVDRREGQFYQVDARKTGTNLTQEHYTTKEAAEKRAAELEAEYSKNGKEGLSLPQELRYMAATGADMLKPFGKSVLQACEFYRDYLAEEQRKQSGALVELLAKEWYEYKKAGARKAVRKDTLIGIRAGQLQLERAFTGRTITSITKQDITAFIDPQPIAVISKRNICSLFGQFFNWCIQEGKGITKNPTEGIDYKYEKGETTIWLPEFSQRAMTLCEERYPEFTTFHALGLFGGLRPKESREVVWEYIDWEHLMLYVPKHISKVKDDRNVPINEVLRYWLELTPKDKRKGLIVRKENFTNRIREFRAELGYKYATERNGKALNPNGPLGEYTADVLRHSYGTYWLNLHNNRAQLAEDMGNSVQVITAHYKRVVQRSVAEKHWQIVPKAVRERMEEEARKAAATKLAEEELYGAGEEIGGVDPEDVKAALAVD